MKQETIRHTADQAHSLFVPMPTRMADATSPTPRHDTSSPRPRHALITPTAPSSRTSAQRPTSAHPSAQHTAPHTPDSPLPPVIPPPPVAAPLVATVGGRWRALAGVPCSPPGGVGSTVTTTPPLAGASAPAFSSPSLEVLTMNKPRRTEARCWVYFATVTGNGRFPLDMLRHDGAYPRTEADAGIIESTFDREHTIGGWSVRIVAISQHSPRTWGAFTRGRWHSFGATVEETDE